MKTLHKWALARTYTQIAASVTASCVGSTEIESGHAYTGVFLMLLAIAAMFESPKEDHP